MFIVFIVLFFFLLSSYLLRKAYLFFKALFPRTKFLFVFIGYSILSFPTLLIFFISDLNETVLKKAIMVYGYYWMGFFFYLFFFFLIADIILMICKAFKLLASPLSRKVLIISIVSTLVVSLSFIGYNLYNKTQIKDVSYNISINKSSPSGDINAVLISDLHLGYINDQDFLKNVVERTNALNPDIIFISGDIFDGNFHSLGNISQLRKLFNSFSSKYGTYACFGNHDAGSTYVNMYSFLKSTNVTLLNDEAVTIDNSFTILGRKDISPIGSNGVGRNDFDFNNLDKELPIIVLDHQPSSYNEYPDYVDLILSGHTHRGQMFPINFITNLVHIEDYGYYRKSQDSPQMIITSGVGTWGPPMRSGSNCEIVTLAIDFE